MAKVLTQHFIKPDWPAPKTVCAWTSTRRLPYEKHDTSKIESTNYAEFNLATHVNDNPETVKHNRALLRQALDLPAEPCWLQQVHGDTVLNAGDENKQIAELPIADAAYSHTSKRICVILTADCLPVLLCNKQGTVVAAVHAGWRSLQQDILQKTILSMGVEPGDLMAWLGPAISQKNYEVGQEVYQQFFDKQPYYDNAFTPVDTKHWHFDLYALAKIQLQSLGVFSIYGGEYCTYTEAEHFFSYRRDGETGRMVSIIWLSN